MEAKQHLKSLLYYEVMRNIYYGKKQPGKSLLQKEVRGEISTAVGISIKNPYCNRKQHEKSLLQKEATNKIFILQFEAT